MKLDISNKIHLGIALVATFAGCSVEGVVAAKNGFMGITGLLLRNLN